jgi:hypothetical protein
VSEAEDRLRDALHRAADRSNAVAPSAERLLRLHRHHVYRRNAMVGASLAAVGVGAWAVTDVATAGGSGSDTVGVRPATSPSSRGTPLTNAACAAGPLVTPNPSAASPSPSPSPSSLRADAAAQDQAAAAAAQAAHDATEHPSTATSQEKAALDRISLPDPAPGFPVWRAKDTTAMTDFGSGVAWTRTMLRAVKPGTSTTEGSGVIDTTPNGQEATVMVACHGAFPTTPRAVGAAHEYPVIGTTTARGQAATVVRSDTHQIGVLVTVDGWDIAAYGDYGAVPNDPVTPAQLVTLVDALEHLDG